MRPVSALPRGLTYARVAIALALNKGDPQSAAMYAGARWGDSNPATRLLVEKANVGAIATGTTFVGEGLAEAEFWGLVEQKTIIGQLAGLIKVQFQTPTLSLLTGVSAEWIAEGGGKGVVKPTYEKQAGLPRTKVAGIGVATKETLMAPQSELSIRDEIVRAIAEQLDRTFIDPSNAGSTSKPASVTYNAAFDATGGSPASSSLADDIETLIANFTGDLTQAYFVTSPALAAKLSGADRPAVGARGGELQGIPTITSVYVPSGLIVLLDPSGIAVAEGVSELETSDKATIDMVDVTTTSSVTASGANPVSLFQTNSVGILAAKEMNWRRVRSNSVAIASNAFGY